MVIAIGCPLRFTIVVIAGSTDVVEVMSAGMQLGSRNQHVRTGR